MGIPLTSAQQRVLPSICLLCVEVLAWGGFPKDPFLGKGIPLAPCVLWDGQAKEGRDKNVSLRMAQRSLST